jgi:hypothetical protein
MVQSIDDKSVGCKDMSMQMQEHGSRVRGKALARKLPLPHCGRCSAEMCCEPVNPTTLTGPVSRSPHITACEVHTCHLNSSTSTHSFSTITLLPYPRDLPL